MQTANNVKDYMAEKQNTVKRILKQLYTYSAYSDILYMLSHDMDKFSPDFTAYMRNMNEYLMLSAYMDNDIVGININDDSKDVNYYYSQDHNADTIDIKYMKNEEIQDAVRERPFGPSILPAFTPDKTINYNLFPIVSKIKDSAMVKDLGTLEVYFNTTNFHEVYHNGKRKYDSNIIVLTGKGSVIYDSTGKYYNKPYPFFDELKDPSRMSYSLEKKSIVSVVRDSDLNLIIASILPQSQVYKDTVPFRNAILVLSVLCIIASLFLAYVSIYYFSKRITAINTAISKVQAGDLSVRVNTHKWNDEISQIASNFNDMCIKLDNYINRVYIAELNQKESDLKRKDAELKQRVADLYSLQSQINPHFLHNTLEAIRMRAVSEGNNEVGKMAHILSTIFRNSIKKEMVIPISEEINQCRMYLELYNIRYNENLDVEYDVDTEIMKYGILKHLLQPLLENSIVHGINLAKPGNRIEIRGIKEGDDITFKIVDNGRGIPEKEVIKINEHISSLCNNENESIGILNVNHRIRLVYGNAYGLQINSVEGQGTEVTITIAAKTVKELNEYVQGNAG
jgi:Putative regulator of cell autolysis